MSRTSQQLSFFLVLGLAGTACGAAAATAAEGGGAPVEARRCDTALVALQARENEVIAARRAAHAGAQQPAVPDASLERLRREAAAACLGPAALGASGPPQALVTTQAKTQVQVPMRVAPITQPAEVSPATAPLFGSPPAAGVTGAAPRLPLVPFSPFAPNATPAPVAPPGQANPVRPPAGIAACDATGCWTSDGRRLQRTGPVLLGPRGFCTLNGTLLSCP
jgi:hypothetical protein